MNIKSQITLGALAVVLFGVTGFNHPDNSNAAKGYKMIPTSLRGVWKASDHSVKITKYTMTTKDKYGSYKWSMKAKYKNGAGHKLWVYRQGKYWDLQPNADGQFLVRKVRHHGKTALRQVEKPQQTGVKPHITYLYKK